MYIKNLNCLLRSRIHNSIPFVYNEYHAIIFNRPKYINLHKVILFKKLSSNSLPGGLIYAVNILQSENWKKSLYNSQSLRLKSSKSKKNKNQKDEESDEESEEEEEWILEKHKNFKDMKVKIPSLRIDAVLKAGLGMSRRTVEENFYGGKIKINNNAPKKKSITVVEGDFLDVTIKKELGPETIRIKMLKIGEYDELKDRFTVLFRKYSKIPEDLEKEEF